MADNSSCRIGVFYDGSYFTYAQKHFFKQNLGWLCFLPFHILIENFIKEREQGFSTYKVVYAAWHQGLFTSTQTTQEQLKAQRNRDHDLIHAGIELKYESMSRNEEEKGVDVAIAIDALTAGLQRKIDVAVLVTGDGDFVPLARALRSHDVRVLAAYFKYDNNGYNSSVSRLLLKACNYVLDVTALQKDPHHQWMFRELFRQSNKQHSLNVGRVAVQ